MGGATRSEFEARCRAALAELARTRMRPRHYAPPLWRWLRALGLRWPPPSYAPFWTNALVFGAFAAVLFVAVFGVIALLADSPLGWHLGWIAAGMGLGFGLGQAAFTQYRARDHRLSAWVALEPNAPDEPASARTARAFLEAYARLDHAALVALLTDDVAWTCPGLFDLHGKDAVDREIECGASTGPPAITIERIAAEADVAVVMGHVRVPLAGGGHTSLHFCDVFELSAGRIARLTSYLMPLQS